MRRVLLPVLFFMSTGCDFADSEPASLSHAARCDWLYQLSDQH